MRRAPLKTFAAHDAPYALDRQLRTEIAAHQAVLAGGPPEVAAELDAARESLSQAQARATEVAERLSFARAQASLIGPLAGLRREPRARRERWVTAAGVHRVALVEAQRTLTHWRAEVSRLEPMRDERVAWHHDQSWRLERVREATAELDAHWARTVLGATREDDPLAFGIDRLRQARHHFAEAARHLEAALSPDRSEALARAEAELDHHQVNHRHALDVRARAEQRLEKASTRHLGMRDKPAIAAARIELDRAGDNVERTAEQLVRVEAVVRVERRDVAIRTEVESRIVPERGAANQAIGMISEALAATRPERVAAAAADPAGAHLGHLLGPVPEDPNGQEAWCGLAVRIETALDEPSESARLGWSHQHLDAVVAGLLRAEPTSVDFARNVIARASARPGPGAQVN